MHGRQIFLHATRVTAGHTVRVVDQEEIINGPQHPPQAVVTGHTMTVPARGQEAMTMKTGADLPDMGLHLPQAPPQEVVDLEETALAEEEGVEILILTIQTITDRRGRAPVSKTV